MALEYYLFVLVQVVIHSACFLRIFYLCAYIGETRLDSTRSSIPRLREGNYILELLLRPPQLQKVIKNPTRLVRV